jgi:hypothetical protein
VANDAAAIQSALAAGKPVYVPAGTYRCSGVAWPDGAVVSGDGSSSWLQGKVQYGSASKFTDLKIGPASAGTAAIQNLHNASGTSFTRCRFRGGGGSLQEDYSCVNIGAASGTGPNVANLTFTGCEFERSLGAFNCVSIYAQGCTIDGVTFDGCHFGLSNGVADGSDRMMIECWTDHGTGNWWRNLTFRGCTFETSDYHQLDFACYGDSGQGDGVLVEGCTFKGGGENIGGTRWGYGICLEWPKNVVIRNNRFQRCDEAAIYSANFGQSYNTGWSITGNTFDWDAAENGIIARRGIVVLTGAGNVVTGNTFIWHGSFSAWASNGCVELSEGATGNTITGNAFYISQTQKVVNEWGGASGNTISPNTVVRE